MILFISVIHITVIVIGNIRFKGRVYYQTFGSENTLCGNCRCIDVVVVYMESMIRWRFIAFKVFGGNSEIIFTCFGEFEINTLLFAEVRKYHPFTVFFDGIVLKLVLILSFITHKAAPSPCIDIEFLIDKDRFPLEVHKGFRHHFQWFGDFQRQSDYRCDTVWSAVTEII